MSKVLRRVIFGVLYAGFFLAPVVSIGAHLLHFKIDPWHFHLARHVDPAPHAGAATIPSGGLNLFGISAGSTALLLVWVGVFLRSEVCLSRVAVFSMAVCKLITIWRVPSMWM